VRNPQSRGCVGSGVESFCVFVFVAGLRCVVSLDIGELFGVLPWLSLVLVSGWCCVGLDNW
jgi:hypothetical protein